MSFKREDASVIWCSSNELSQRLFDGGTFACWLHICKKEWPEFEDVIRHLVASGCSLIYTSGNEPKLWHDKADDILIELKREDVLTAWSDDIDGVPEYAEEFWNITRRYSPNRLFGVVDDSQLEEYRLAAEILSAFGRQSS